MSEIDETGFNAYFKKLLSVLNSYILSCPNVVYNGAENNLGATFVKLTKNYLLGLENPIMGIFKQYTGQH